MMEATIGPMVSVDMITYKHEHFIRQAIEGVLAQETTFEFDLIIADDCSPDGTQEIVNEIIRSHPAAHRIKYFRHEKNIGMQANGKFAVDQCKGKYIALCEGDDYWIDPLKLQKQVSFLEENSGYSFTFHNRYILDFDGNMNTETLGDAPQSIEVDRIISTFVPTATMVFLNDVYDYDHTKLQDIFSADVALRAFLSTKGKGYFMPFFGSVYRQHAGGMSSSQNYESNRRFWLESRNQIENGIKGIHNGDLNFSKFIIVTDLAFYYFRQRAFLKALNLFPNLIVSGVKSGRFSTVKIFGGAVKGLFRKNV